MGRAAQPLSRDEELDNRRHGERASAIDGPVDPPNACFRGSPGQSRDPLPGTGPGACMRLKFLFVLRSGVPMHIAIAVAVLAATASATLLAQDKLERERSVKASQVPEEARSWLRDAFGTARSPKWYQEIYESGYSYEAKFKLRGQYYSVEFAPDGTIQDVEIEVGFAELPASVRQEIRDYLSSAYRQFKIHRLQIQYSGAPADLKDFFSEDVTRGLTIRYEIEYTATASDAPTHYREGLFDVSGQHLRSRRVIMSPSENLIF